MLVRERFVLNDNVTRQIMGLTPKFGYNGFGEAVFYRTYSRIKSDGGQETWNDVVIRVMNGVMSIRKDHYLRNGLSWDERFWQDYAGKMALSLFYMEWMPPGRGLWSMGTDFVYERGSMSLYNCAYTEIHNDLADSCAWIMDCLMNGVGVGFGPCRDDSLKMYTIKDRERILVMIPDSREGWVESVRDLITCFLDPKKAYPVFDYSLIRKKGLPIRGFGGLASGPEPLMHLHSQIVETCGKYLHGVIDSVRLKADIVNMIGCCVIAGNVRRSAELACGPITDKTFLDLKNYDKHPDRKAYGWMSNNSVLLERVDDFEHLGEIAQRVIKNGEPGYINSMNLRFGRLGKDDKVREDRAVGFNPCGEIPLESRETCNLVETFPTMCGNIDEWYKACEYATVYASTVSLLPTNQPSTNKVIARNRRIGVSIVDITGWIHTHGLHKVIRWLRQGYQIVRAANSWVNGEAGVPEAIRVTTIKPGGTTPKLPGRTPGMSFPNFHHMIRTMRVQQDSPIYEIFHEAGYQHEPDVVSAFTEVFEFPVLQGPARHAGQVSLWEQAMLLVMLQREWADNAVSNTLNFRPKWKLIDEIPEGKVYEDDDCYIVHTLDGEQRTYPLTDAIKFETKPAEYGDPEKLQIFEYDESHEEDIIENVLSAIAPMTKSVSLLPHTTQGVYKQMPEQGITPDEYERRLSTVKAIDWTRFRNSDGVDEKFCDGDNCTLPNRSSH